jgi:hypothetical protein
LLLTPSRESRSGGSIAGVLNNKVRVLSVGIKDSRSIRCCNREAEDNRSTLLAKDDTEGKILTSLKGIRGAGTVCGCTAAICFGIVVVQAISPVCSVSKVQIGDVVDLGCGKGVVAIHLGKDISTVVEDKVSGGDILRGAVQVDLGISGFVDTSDLGRCTIVVRGVIPVVRWVHVSDDVVTPGLIGIVRELNSLVATNRRLGARHNRGC